MKSKDHKGDMDNTAENENLTDESTPMEAALPDANVEEIDPIAKLEAELTESRDKYLYMYSEFENYKRRVSRDRIEQSKLAGSDVFLAILPILDDMERAIKSFESTSDVEAIKAGINLIYSKLKSTTESKGLKPMDATGKPFDADLHDAITNIPAPSPDLKGKVIDEVEKGYFLNDKVIRHAKVVVGN
ncbi:MAG: nucleotide exchange factor GrpE [Bacteroidetes bacterium]|nr:nucleotide exchange factor GrpE [Bacteroidota bacterium]MBK9414762.1 nucleotide exchange factor GrpE [Bacteroidota bacterium]MBP6426486.1 nucleotide exchange factor GrpE [Bacteroidia bacterium]MBP6657186.1 nucleotide exchange factor GrpE [Bacteroidia bacterium]